MNSQSQYFFTLISSGLLNFEKRKSPSLVDEALELDLLTMDDKEHIQICRQVSVNDCGKDTKSYISNLLSNAPL